MLIINFRADYLGKTLYMRCLYRNIIKRRENLCLMLARLRKGIYQYSPVKLCSGNEHEINMIKY